MKTNKPYFNHKFNPQNDSYVHVLNEPTCTFVYTPHCLIRGVTVLHVLYFLHYLPYMEGFYVWVDVTVSFSKYTIQENHILISFCVIM